jgi:hypothetical protein
MRYVAMNSVRAKKTPPKKVMEAEARAGLGTVGFAAYPHCRICREKGTDLFITRNCKIILSPFPQEVANLPNDFEAEREVVGGE